jgi:tetratricopeptide (TPR) repeat protein
VLLGVAGARLYERRIGFAAGLALAVWPSAVFADALVQKSVLDVLGVCALLATLGGALGATRERQWVVPGATLGFLALTRENALVLAPVLLGFVGVGGPRGVARRAAAWLVLGVLLVLAPVALRNWRMDGELQFTTAQFGPNFFIGNNERATGGYRPLVWGRGDPRFERHDATALAERAVGRSLTPGEVSRYWTDRALAFIRAEPGRWLRLVGRKTVLLTNRIELADAEDQYTYGDWSTWLAVATPVLGFGLLVPVAMAGLVLAWSQRATRLLAAMLAAYAATVVGTFVMARYRHPMLPLFLLVAVAGLPQLCAAAPRRRLLAVALALATGVPANWPVVSEATVRAGSLYNLGRALQDEPGRLDEAASYYRRALALDSGFALGHNNLGVLLQRAGRFDEAQAAFERALALEPDRADFVYNVAHLAAARGDAATAQALYERVLAMDPRSVDAHVNLGVLLQGQGRLDDALRHFDAALAIDARNVLALNDRGVALGQQGRHDDAVIAFRAALAVDPADPSARVNLAIALAAAGRAHEAATELATGVVATPDDATLRHRLGTLLVSLGRAGDAIPHLEAATRLAPDALVTAESLADAYAAAGRADDAVRERARAARLRAAPAADQGRK